jgi:hypothetical protein
MAQGATTCWYSLGALPFSHHPPLRLGPQPAGLALLSTLPQVDLCGHSLSGGQKQVPPEGAQA